MISTTFSSINPLHSKTRYNDTMGSVYSLKMDSIHGFSHSERTDTMSPRDFTKLEARILVTHSSASVVLAEQLGLQSESESESEW